MILFRKGEVLPVSVSFTELDGETELDVSGATPEYRLDDGAWTALTMLDAAAGQGQFVFTAAEVGSVLVSYRLTWGDGSIEVLPSGGDDTLRVI